MSLRSDFIDLHHTSACIQAVDFYLDEARSNEKAEIIRLCKNDDPSDNASIMGYIREAQSA